MITLDGLLRAVGLKCKGTGRRLAGTDGDLPEGREGPGLGLDEFERVCFAFMAEYPDEVRKWSTRAGAEYQCWEASQLFLKFVANGFPYRIASVDVDLEPDGPAMQPELKRLFKVNPSGCEGHTFNVMWDFGPRGIVVDWTARQYDPSVAFPYVYEFDMWSILDRRREL